MNYEITKTKNGFLLKTDSIYLDKNFIYPTKSSAKISAELVGYCSVDVLENIFNSCSYFDNYDSIFSYIQDLSIDLKTFNDVSNSDADVDMDIYKDRILLNDDLANLFEKTINELTKFIEIYFE